MGKVAVVILNWNGKNLLEKFLPFVLKFSEPYSIYLADNASTDDSVNYTKENFPAVQIIQSYNNGGFAKGYNTALKEIKASYYILLNSDVEVTENWINPIIQMMDEDSSIAACQPKMLDYKRKTHFEYAGAAGGFIDKWGYPFCRGRILWNLEEDKGQYNEVSQVFWATGACMFIRSDSFWEVNGFDEEFFAHMEEIDICWRLQNIGYKIMVYPKTVVYHIGGASLPKTNSKKTYLNFRNNLLMLAKNLPDKRLYKVLLIRLFLDGLAAVKFLLGGDGLDNVAAIFNAHGYFYKHFKHQLKKRPNNTIKDFPKTVYSKNIVSNYYLKNKKRFSQLNFDIKYFVD